MELLNNNTRPRRDPLKDDFDIDSARIGYEILTSGVAYWKPGTVPQRPLGVVRFEALRQGLTFAIPAAMEVFAWLTFGKVAAAVTAPVALLTGYALDHLLQRDIARKQAEEDKRDNGHYARVRELCIRLNLTPEEITANRVIKLANAYMAERSRRMAQWEASRAAVSAVKLSAVEAGAAGVSSLRLDTAATADAFGSDEWLQHQDEYRVEPMVSDYSGYPDFNPANGAPMISGTPFDVTGHIFGTDGS